VARDIGIDLGTSNTTIYVKDKGVILREPSVVALNTKTNEVLAVGTEAKKMIGRTPANIVAIKPLQHGVISNFDVTAQMLKHFIKAVLVKPFLTGPNILISVPSKITEVEAMAVKEAAAMAGANKRPQIISSPIAAALGADMDIEGSTGSMVVDLGGGTTEIAVLSMNGIVTSKSIRIAGDELDEAIIAYMKKEYNLLIGERSAEDIKISIGTAFTKAQEEYMEVKGRDLVAGLPKNVKLSSSEVLEAIKEPINAIIEAIKDTMEDTPPELAADIMDRGIVLTGGGALLSGLSKIIKARTGIPVIIAEHPLDCVVLGIGKCLEQPKLQHLME